ncbi:MAG: saccharopine dehydrogenase C-terminal domain-containing protein [Bacteroidota bacterium]
MKHILLLGAGRSTRSLIEYLLTHAHAHGWELTIADIQVDWIHTELGTPSYLYTQTLSIEENQQRESLIGQADLVLSMLPARFHPLVAESCLKLGKSMFTASYTPPEIKAMDSAIQSKNLLFLMECGLDPGLDHMSAMRVIHQIRAEGHELTGFESFTGGLLSPTPYDNPWEYKFTWNPRNVVLAGNGGAKFIQNGTYKYIPYHKLFNRTEIIHIPSHGYFEGYANRDCLKYLEVYQLQGIQTLYRGTLRRVGYCKAWNTFVQLGTTDDSFEMEGVAHMTHRDFINSFMYYNPSDSVELKLAHYMQLDMEGEEMYRLKWLGIFDEEPIGLDRGTPAQILEHILKKKWTLFPEDRDLIVMYHKFNFLDKGHPREIRSHMVIQGEDENHTGMAKTVGLPLGIAVRLYLEGKLDISGVRVPIIPELYEPILRELEAEGVRFVEREMKTD